MRLRLRITFALFLSLLCLLFFAKPTFALVGRPNDVGPELPDKFAGPNVVDRYGFRGVVSVINFPEFPPVNTVPSKSNQPTTLRVWVNSSTTAQIARQYAQQLNNVAGSEFPNIGFIIFGNELNNLSGEWKNTSVSLQKAAQDYADLFVEFANVLDDRFTLAPAAPDLYNADWDPKVWVKAFDQRMRANGGCGKVDILVANVFDAPPQVPVTAQGAPNGNPNLNTWRYLESNVCGGKQVKAFQGWGAHPDKPLKDQVDFLDNTPLPDGIASATTLIPPYCKGGRVTNAQQEWWYYIPGPDGKGSVYKADGSKVDPETCSDTGNKFEIKDIPCSGTMDPEFHSLRPYPASPCNREIQDRALLCGNDLLIKEEYEFPADRSGAVRCEQQSDGGWRCVYQVTSKVKISTDFANAELPIMGNTQLVPNAVRQSSNLSFATRMNEYVSWYLNGTVQRAEEFPLISTDPFSLNDLITYAGPLRKLLPAATQTLFRNYQKINAGSTRHNQIVACGPNGDPAACYSNSPGANQRVRLTTPPQGRSESYIPYSSTEDRVGQILAGEQATQPTSPTGVMASEFKFTPIAPHRNAEPLYFAHMQEDAELAKLLQYTFMTQGQEGWSKQALPNPIISGPAGCVVVETRSNPGDDLYAEYDRGGPGNPERIEGVVDYKTAEFSCDFPPPKVRSSCVSDCVSNGESVDICSAKPECIDSTPSCKKDVFIAIDMQTYTPKADEIWERLVVGSWGVFKKMFPKVGPGTPVEEIKDIPGKTYASYTATSDGDVNNRINTQPLAGDIENQKNASQAELYFPHLGGVYDYFLKDIQKALRPKVESIQTATQSADLSSYFGTLKDTNKTFNTTASFCGLTYVSPADAARYADKLRKSLPAQKEFWERYYSGYIPTEIQNLFASCGGTNCLDFILSTVINTPICKDNIRLNPYVAVAIALNETGGLRNQAGTKSNQHFGCTASSFSEYKDNGQAKTANGLVCTVITADGRQVINPMIGPPLSQQDVNACIPNTATPTWQNTRFDTTVEDGLACMISRFNAYCRTDLGNKGDVAALNAYGYASLENIYGNIIRLLLRDDTEGLASKFSSSCNF